MTKHRLWSGVALIAVAMAVSVADDGWLPALPLVAGLFLLVCSFAETAHE